MPALKGTKTEKNLKDAFAGESQANRRYLYFARKADIEGYNDVSAVFRSTAEGETGHAHGHLEYLEEVGDPATDLPIGPTQDNLKAAIAGETYEYTDRYPAMAKSARKEGFEEIDDANRRARVLARLGGVENTVTLSVDGETIRAAPEGDVERSTGAGRTSSVHFLRFPFTRPQIGKFARPGADVTLGIGQENYGPWRACPRPSAPPWPGISTVVRRQGSGIRFETLGF